MKFIWMAKTRKRKLPLDVEEEVQEEASENESDRQEEVFDEFSSFLDTRLNNKDVDKVKSGSRKPFPFHINSLPAATLSRGISSCVAPLTEECSLQKFGWIEKIVTNLTNTVEKESTDKKDELKSIMGLIARYLDVSMITNKKSLYKLGYCSHALNHVIRTRNLVLRNKKKLEKASNDGEVDDELIETLRDQGFVRPTVLILLPYRKHAYQVVGHIKKLLFGEDAQRVDVLNKSRFEEEFGGRDNDLPTRVKEDEEDGNSDDCFRVGLALSRKSLKLYTPFDISDILICSPLGLRMIIGGDEGKESHLLSSLQLVVVDHADVLLQLNWEHVSLIMNTMHRQTTKMNTDMSRIRLQYLDGQASLYCQTLLFSSFRHELFTSLSIGRCNHRGLVTFMPPSEGILAKLEIGVCQELYRVNVHEGTNISDARYAFFKEKILPSLPNHTAIFIPSYFDYVRLRNVLKKETESFVQCHEYAEEAKINRARHLFYRGEKKLMLITERFHHFNRYRITGIHRLVFYQPPSCPSFYSDLINMCQPTGRLLSTLLYTSSDRIRMQNIFGFRMGNEILKSEKSVQAIVSE